MDEITHFDNFCGTYLRAVLIDNKLFNKSYPQSNLYEVWIMPEMSNYFTRDLLQRMCVNSIFELVTIINPKTCPSDRLVRAIKKEYELISYFSPYLTFNNTCFCYEAYETNEGFIVRVLFGDKKTIQDFHSLVII